MKEMDVPKPKGPADILSRFSLKMQSSKVLPKKKETDVKSNGMVSVLIKFDTTVVLLPI